MEFKQIVDENDILYHKAYILLCEIFPGMMPYWAFKNYDLTVAINKENTLTAFMLLDHCQVKKLATIVSIGVDQKVRKCGIADAYIKWVKSLFPNYSIELHVSIKNTGAIKLYKNNGFQIAKTKEKYYMEHGFDPYVGKGVNAYLMVCTN